jgi:hypothetical protein
MSQVQVFEQPGPHLCGFQALVKSARVQHKCEITFLNRFQHIWNMPRSLLASMRTGG